MEGVKSFQCRYFSRVRDLKNSGKYSLGLTSKLSLGLIYGLSFRIQAASYFPQSWVQKTGLIFYLVRIDAFRVFMRTRLNIEPYSPLKPTKVGFIFLKSSRRSCSCQSCDTSCRQSWVEDWVLKSGLRNYNSRRSF